VVALALVGSLIAGVSVFAAPKASAPTLEGPLTTEADTAAMVDLEWKINDSMQQGKVVEINFRTADQVPGDVESTWSWGDSGLWTGVYAGGQAMRYAVAKAKLAELKDKGKSAGKGNSDNAPGHEELTFWRGQRDEALARVKTILVAQHREINIAKDWQGTLKIPPAVNPAVDPDDPGNNNPLERRHLADFGGGIIKGEPGMLMRACTPTGLGRLGVNPPTVDDDQPVNNNSNRVYEINSSDDDGKPYYCETSPSRDTYAGVIFGLVLMFDLVGPDEPELRDQIRSDLLAMGNFLLKYAWWYPRPHGYVAPFPFQNDFDGFISPLFVHVPMARLSLTSAVRHVVNNGGTEADRQKWNAVWAEELASQGPELGPSMEFDVLENYEPYYKFNLHHLNAFTLLRTATGAERDFLARSFAILDKTTHDDVNAHFEAITYALTGDDWRLDAAVTHVREWLQYRARVETGEQIHNSPRCEPDHPDHIECLPQDEYHVYTDEPPNGRIAYRPGQPDAPPISESPGLKAAQPLPVADRPPWDFIWQRGPQLLDFFAQGRSWRTPGIDFLTPYWMIRYHTEVAPPDPNPFPEWVGPAH
jgi:hypothetical protein